MKNLTKRLCALMLALAMGAALSMAALAAVQLPTLSASECVVDDAGVLSDDTTAFVENINGQLEQSCSGAQIGVLTVQYTGGVSTEDYALEALNTWGVGSSENNNGVLILLVMESDTYADGDYYLSYGIGYRNTTLESQASAIAQTMEDAFAAQNYDEAVRTCVQNTADTIAGIYGVSLSSGSTGGDDTGDYYEQPKSSFNIFAVIEAVFVIFLLVVIALDIFVGIGRSLGFSMMWGPMRFFVRHSPRPRRAPPPPGGFYDDRPPRDDRGPRPPRGGGMGGGPRSGGGGSFHSGGGSRSGGSFGGMGGGRGMGGGGGRGR